MRILSWNVNGLRAVAKKGALEEYLADPAAHVARVRGEAEAFCMDASEVDKAIKELRGDDGEGLLASVVGKPTSWNRER